ncbi:Zinc/iron permease [Morchella snyderi]|nr:Zinc/iron permease [Morchella snyderi]
MASDDDKTGWILACASGLACVAGSSIICLDLITRQVPRWKHFSIRESTTFLSASLSLSFGVMFYSALYGMLPKAHTYFLTTTSSTTAAYATIGSFLAGVAGLQIVSDTLHHMLPSSIVNCEEHASESKPKPPPPPPRDLESGGSHHGHRHGAAETTPLLTPAGQPALVRQPSIKQKLSGFVKCKADGTCYGFTDHVCQQRCDPVMLLADDDDDNNDNGDNGDNDGLPLPPPASTPASSSSTSTLPHQHQHQHAPLPPPPQLRSTHSHSHAHVPLADTDKRGHHHVAKNKFLSIGVQTSLAIALHKIPEGFITYATNHASPQLGFSVFLALFIHNIAEGFIMSLPLFLALRSRARAVLWASVLGGLAQPLGAGLAAVVMRGEGGGGDGEVGGVGYGVLFAVTAGIMASVGVTLFSQAVALKHGSRVPFVFGFVGMGLLGVSFALTAER